MLNPIPDATIKAFARTICQEADKYGFSKLDMVRLINALLDHSTDNPRASRADIVVPENTFEVSQFPLTSQRIMIRPADQRGDKQLLESWMQDEYGRHFLLSCATAQPTNITALLTSANNDIGIVMLSTEEPIGVMAFLDVDHIQQRAELRKLIAVRNERGKGYAEEATRLWIKYGFQQLGLEKIYVSTLQTHIRNIQLNEAIGFRVEGVLHNEVLIGAHRHDVLRMGMCVPD